MTYTRMTLTDFQAVFTEFSSVTEAQYDFWATRAEAVIDSSYGADQAYATQLLTAHFLTMQGLGTSTQSQRFKNFGGANRVKSGDLELGWSSGSSSGASSYRDTTYGRDVLQIVRAHKGTPRVTATGCFPPRVPYGLA